MPTANKLEHNMQIFTLHSNHQAVRNLETPDAKAVGAAAGFAS